MDHQHTHIDVNQLASTLRGKLLQKSPWPAQCCIFRVPSTLRSHNENVYEPKLVSIGPFHRRDKNLQSMEKIKLWYLDCLLARAPTSQTRLECFIEAIRVNVDRCIESYAEKVNLSTDKFVEMMVVYGCFIIELFRKYAETALRSMDDPIFKTSWMRKNLLTDLLLLENQLPWFVLECLFNLTNKADHGNNMSSLCQLAIQFFTLNTLRTGPLIGPNPQFQNNNFHLLDLQCKILISSSSDKEYHKYMNSIPCVTELLQAGVNFKEGDPNEILNIQFKDGVMIIPPITILDNAESFIRNLIAYEQCDHSCEDKITSYAVLLENLINSRRDIDFLRKKGIITCYLSTEDLTKFFRRLYKDADVFHYPDSYVELSDNVRKYCQARWPRWRVILLRDYFNNPWSVCSFFAAILILILAFMQTLYSILYH